MQTAALRVIVLKNKSPLGCAHVRNTSIHAHSQRSTLKGFHPQMCATVRVKCGKLSIPRTLFLCFCAFLHRQHHVND